ncbi:RICIN domain-containing protein [Actinoplanes sp. Pm04-4]|uniref:RICIN domain-containing protein n=1 Tax=Paractinoplanes pyxinae TaxID=2997416 RepID=A0ABT4B8E0_9ACTN|nr:ricin-type beta-trefoil lectin domain protein [Actinoplanes pyxinae]MCY1142774.1 RICIN domain-containing protein [Actinoplanes pyxinae]
MKKRIIAALSAVVVPAAVVGISVLPSDAAALPATGGTYQLAVTKSGKCIDVPGASTANGALLQQWGCTSGAGWQQFKLVAAGSNYLLQNVSSGKCIDVPGASTASGTQLQQWGCASGQTNQQWRLAASGTNTFQIINVGNGLCISDKDASTASGAAIIQETCSANSNKQWAFQAASNQRTWPSTPDGFASTGGGTTGGAAGTTVTVTTLADLQKYVTATEPYVIRVNGAITVTPKGTELKVKSNKTIVGVGTSGHIVGGGFFLGEGVRNVIIRNLTIRDTAMPDDDPDDKVYDYDGIQMDTADHIWIDHNTITRMNDGSIDSRKDTTYLTVSWNVLSNNNKSFGIGWTDNVTARMTIHHNWLHDTNQRNPSVDNVAYAHLYNNYLQNITSYGNLSRGSTKLVLENSYFDNVKNPYYNDTSAAQLKQSGSIVVNSSGKQQTNGSAFTPSSYYSYALDPAADVPALLKTYAGPQANIGQ